MIQRTLVLIVMCCVLFVKAQNPYDCTGKPNGDYVDPSAPCSGYFYKCSNEYTSYFACGTGLVFSEARGYCDYCASVSPCNANPSNILCPASQPCVKCPSSLPTQTTCSCLGPANCPTSCSIQALGN